MTVVKMKVFFVFSKLDPDAWFYISLSIFFFFFNFSPFFLPFSETSTLLCASLFSSCLETTVPFSPKDSVHECKPPMRSINISKYEVS